MTNDIAEKLTQLETLYSEQEYTIDTLNDIVSRQNQEIAQLTADLQWLKRQLLSLKEQVPEGGSSNADEVPPHY